MKIRVILLDFKVTRSLSLLTDGVSETVKHEIKKTSEWISSSYDDTYGCFIDSTYGLFIDTKRGFFIDKCLNYKKSHETRKRTRS